jgi:fluoride ion exporter CrcB/FEX
MLRILVAELAAMNLSGQTAEYVYLFVVNLLGAFALGVMAKHPYFTRESCRDLWAVGFAGGFTTLSAVSFLLFVNGNWLLIGLMLAIGVLLYAIGFRIGRRLARRAEAAL